MQQRLFPKFNIVRNTKESTVYFPLGGMLRTNMGILIIWAQSVVEQLSYSEPGVDEASLRQSVIRAQRYMHTGYSPLSRGGLCTSFTTAPQIICSSVRPPIGLY